MNPLNIAIIIFSILVLISFVLYFFYLQFYLKNCWDLYPTIFSYVALLFMYIGSIILIVAASCKLSNKAYRGALALLYIADLSFLGSIFAFKFWTYTIYSYTYRYNIFNWASLVCFLIIIPLIVLVHTYLCKKPYDTLVIPSKVSPLQPTYQQY